MGESLLGWGWSDPARGLLAPPTLPPNTDNQNPPPPPPNTPCRLFRGLVDELVPRDALKASTVV